jgi:glutamine synthetase
MIPVEALDILLGGGAGFAVDPMGQSLADPDVIAVPDPASHTLAPWQTGGDAMLRCQGHDQDVRSPDDDDRVHEPDTEIRQLNRTTFTPPGGTNITWWLTRLPLPPSVTLISG